VATSFSFYMLCPNETKISYIKFAGVSQDHNLFACMQLYISDV